MVVIVFVLSFELIVPSFSIVSIVHSGGESKDEFWKTVSLCTDFLPKNKPRYLMGVGFAADLVVCVALGIDMFDCVFPTRTAVSIKYAFNSQSLSNKCTFF